MFEVFCILNEAHEYINVNLMISSSVHSQLTTIVSYAVENIQARMINL